MSPARSRGARLGAVVAVIGAVVAMTAAPAAAARSTSIVYNVGPLTAVQAKGLQPDAFPTPSQCIAAYGVACYTPSEIRKAYGIPDSWTGAGQSIAIVDAYGSPTVQSDLDTFSAAMGIPSTTVHVYCPAGCPATATAHQGGPLGWAGETSLDVQWAHAIAPDATINLVVASNNYGNAINLAVQYAVDHHLGNVLSMSYGSDEASVKGGSNNIQLKQSHAAFQDAVNAGISLFASAGDNGTAGGASYPASDPLVTGVGGTNLTTTDTGSYTGETVWGDFANCPLGCPFGPFGATGGAPSVLFDTPAYQAGVTGYHTRTTSDVAWNASVYTSVLVYVGFNANPDANGFYFYGGTSAGSPQWAAATALLDAHFGTSLGELNPALYGLVGTSGYATAFHDVTSGNNASSTTAGYDAKAGYDLPTGLGSPDLAGLASALESELFLTPVG